MTEAAEDTVAAHSFRVNSIIDGGDVGSTLMVLFVKDLSVTSP